MSETIKIQPAGRVDYVDFIRGFLIIWVVWCHTTCPEIVAFYVRVPVFFFISGTFFRWRPFKPFINKLLKKTLIPFLFFYVVSYVYRIFLYYWDFREIQTFDYLMIFDVFHWDCCRVDYLSVNVPLWYFIGFVIIQLSFWVLYKISSNRWFITPATILLFIAGNLLEIYQIPLPFMLPQSFLNALYFGAGVVLGKKLMETLEHKKESIYLFFIAAVLFLMLVSIPFSMKKEIVNAIRSMPFIVIVFFFFRNVYRIPFFKPLHFYGINSLTILGSHVLIQTIYRRILFKYLHESSIISGCIDVLLTVITLYFVIRFFNRYLPRFVGNVNFGRTSFTPPGSQSSPLSVLG
ncbi:MAG: acyltransferase [Dysgonamonadaceae bacterium]|jgi:fucose 4-O-acetylase-like acetyltransferase|nr:acyltransferase [Dysgonamonadaceae bacterium]